MKKLVTLFVVFFLVTGCASSPNKIEATYVSPLKYRDYDCQMIALETASVERRRNDLYYSLKKEADTDSAQMTAGLLLFWPTLFFLEGGDGPEAAEYARLKGEYEALQDVAIQKKCALEFQKSLDDVPLGTAPETE